MSHHDRQAWKDYHKEQVRQGNYMTRNGQKLVKDSAGGWYKADANSCCGCGHNQQAGTGRGNTNRYNKPPALKESKRGRFW